MKWRAETQEGRTFEGAAFSKTLLSYQRCRRTRRDPSSSNERRRKVARSWVRLSVMAHAHTAERRGVPSAVSRSRRSTNRAAAIRVLKSGDAAVQVVLVRSLDFRGHD